MRVESRWERHADDLGIARDDAGSLMGIDGIAVIAFPFFQVVGEGYADALSLEAVLRIDPSGIVEHDKAMAQGALWVFIDGALILHQLLPPLHVLVVDAEQRGFSRLPLVGLGDVAISPGQPDV